MYGQVTEPTVQRKFLKVSKTHTYGGILQDATSLYIPDMFTNVHSKTRCGRINITYKNEAKCRQLFACSQLGANHSPQHIIMFLALQYKYDCYSACDERLDLIQNPVHQNLVMFPNNIA